MKKGTVVLISSIHWHSTWQRHQDIAIGLAEAGYQVVFVEPLPKRWPGLKEWQRVWGRLAGSAQLSGSCPQPEHPDVAIVSPKALPDVGTVGRMANRRFFVPELVKRLEGMGVKRPLITINYLPTPASLALQQTLQPDVAIYDCVVDWSTAPFTDSLVDSEAQLLQQADLVFADSPYLFEKMSARHHHVVQVLPAVHLDTFQMAQTRQEGEKNGRLRCAYFGTLGVSVDTELITAVSHQFPLRLIGPLRTELPNLASTTELCGTVPHHQVPELLQDIDVLLLPYRKAAHMPAVIPAKTFECLATGKPTIAIGLPSLIDYKDLFYLVNTHDSFLAAIEQTRYESPQLRQKRIQCAAQNSWPQRISQIRNYIDETLSVKTHGIGSTNKRVSHQIEV